MSFIDDDLPPHSVESVLHELDLRGSTHAPRILVLYGSLRAIYQEVGTEAGLRVIRPRAGFLFPPVRSRK